MIQPLDIDLYEAVWALARGVVDRLKQAQLQGQSYELYSLVSYLLTTLDAIEQWLRGEDVFHACPPGAFTS